MRAGIDGLFAGLMHAWLITHANTCQITPWAFPTVVLVLLVAVLWLAPAQLLVGFRLVFFSDFFINC